MNILIIDSDKCGLPFALRCDAGGHSVRLWAPPTKIGDGLIEKVKEWRPSMGWADLIFITDNSKLGNQLEHFFQAGFPIFGPNKAGSALELDREIGQQVFEQFGIQTLPYEVFSSYDKAIAYVKKEEKAFVSKPWGGNPDKSLSYVPKTPEDLVCRLQRWKTDGVKGEFLLQEMVEGAEMAVGGWFGPGGWSKWINENWEEKRLMAGGLGPNCYSEDTEVLTRQGWKLFSEVSFEDEVASYNPKSDSMFFEHPSKIYWTDYEGEMYNFKNRYIDLLVTPTHSMWMARRKTSAWSMCEARSCPSEFDLKQSSSISCPDIPPILLSDGTEIDPDVWMRFLGLYLSEGYVNTERPRVVICQNPGPKQDIMLQALLRMGLPWYVNDNKILLTNSALAEYLRPFGHSADKFVPPEVFKASKRQIELFLEAFNLGDGDFSHGRYRYVSGSWNLISDIQALLTMTGKTGVITTDTRTSMISPINGKTYAAQPVFSIEEATRDKVSIRRHEKVFYKGKIGCVTVPTTHLLFVRRNGRVVISGNTGEMGTVLRYVKKSALFEEVLKPVTPYLEEIGYVGYIDVNCLVDDKGTPWPLEFTCRPGWPHFNLCMALHQGDPAEWMKDLLEGKDTLNVSEEICVGVVMAMGDYPWDLLPPKDSEGWPIRGLSSSTLPHLALSSVMRGTAPVAKGKAIIEQEVIVTAGSYVLIATGLGPTVKDAQKAVYEVCDQIYWPPHRIYRNDIGCRLEEDLPKLQDHGFVKGMEFGK